MACQNKEPEARRVDLPLLIAFPRGYNVWDVTAVTVVQYSLSLKKKSSTWRNPNFIRVSPHLTHASSYRLARASRASLSTLNYDALLRTLFLNFNSLIPLQMSTHVVNDVAPECTFGGVFMGQSYFAFDFTTSIGISAVPQLQKKQNFFCIRSLY
jgi:hypothetical protein